MNLPANGRPATVRATGPQSSPAHKECAPRRVVLLAGEEESAVQQVLAEYTGQEAEAGAVAENLHRHAADHPGRYVAVEWLGPRGWVRYLWCRKQ